MKTKTLVALMSTLACLLISGVALAVGPTAVPAHAPEFSIGAAGTALTVLGGGMLMLTGRRRRRARS